MFTQLAPGVALVNAPKDGTPLLADAQAALDLIATARYECGCDALIIEKKDIGEPFFDLSTRIAGEVLQKFVNYSCRLAVVGDFSAYTSKSLHDFIYESNKGSVVCFVPTVEEALTHLQQQH